MAGRAEVSGIVFAEFGVQFHGLSMTMTEVEELRKKLLAAAISVHPGVRYASDIEVDLLTTAGGDKA